MGLQAIMAAGPPRDMLSRMLYYLAQVRMKSNKEWALNAKKCAAGSEQQVAAHLLELSACK